MRSLLLGLAVGTICLTAQPSAVRAAPAVTDHIYQAAHVYNVNAEWMIRIAKCEAGPLLNPNIRSKNGLYSGLFQYSAGTWAWMSTQAGYAGYSPFDPEAASQTTAWALAHGYASHWPRCRYA